MAKTAAVTAPGEERFGGFFDRVKAWPSQSKSFYHDVRSEMKKVTSPNLQEVQSTTAVVIVTVFLFGAFFWLIDLGLLHTIDALIRKLTQH
ncbi:MAG TPA: preprotein translocase subunit SecE [Terriglobales bacterium]|nr:preprotein translocase subunit SecE [Terriglobales bacterium]